MYARTCTHPSPGHGGHKCQGPSTKSEVCNTQPCPGNSLETVKITSHILSLNRYYMWHQEIRQWRCQG